MSDIKDDFVHLHTHSDMSQLDGCGKLADYVKEAARRGSPAIAFTDHGTMRGYYQQMLECQENKIKPIFGIEFYVANDMMRRGVTDEEKAELTKGLKRAEWKAAVKSYEEQKGIRDRWHITVWAKNNDGFKNLMKLASKAWLEGFYYKPRIDLKTLMENGDGLMVATGCLSSPIHDRLVSGKRKKALEVADQLHERFGEDLWLEVMNHDIKEQAEVNKFALELKDRWGKHAKLLATQDAHYIHQGDHEHHEVLLCIGTGDSMSNPARFKFDGTGFWMKTRKEMFSTFRTNHDYMPREMVKEALDSTLDFQERITTNIEIDRFKALMPGATIPPEYDGDEYAYLKKLCTNGWTWRKIPERIQAYVDRKKGKKGVESISYEEATAIYKERLLMELKALKTQKFVTYFLIVHDLYKWVRGANIMCGPGRGSAAGSIVSYLIGITAVDPIEHGLLFERFVSPTRIDMPDIDMDFEDARRQEILEHLRDQYGQDKTCQIATIGKLSGKQCLKDVARVLDVPLREVNEVTASIIERSSGDERASQTIEDSFKEFKVCQDFNKKYPDVLRHAKKLEGMAKTLGIHAAGVIVSPQPLIEVVPLEIRFHEGKQVVVSAVDMYGAAAMGLLKMDVLGLRTLTVLNDCLKAVKARHKDADGNPIVIDPELDIPLDHTPTLQGFTDHDYVGIFQYDSPGADKICSGVKFVTFEDVAAMTALNRPGTARSGLAGQYVARKKNPKLVAKSSFHQKVSEITADTLGIIVYQEHVLRIFTEVAGFSPATADSLRKKIAKKWGDETIGKERENFIKGAMENWGPEGKARPPDGQPMTPEIAGKIMDAITFFGSYGFNKSHATAYGVIAYWGMWLKLKYTLEFHWALMKNEPDRLRIQQFAKGAKKHGIDLLPPDVSVSGKAFTIDPDRKLNAIRGSLVNIKGVGEAASTSIMASQPYKDMFDFLGRVERRKCHKGVILALAKAGALDSLLPNIKWFIENIEEFWKKLAKVGVDSPELKALLEAPKGFADYDAEERTLIASSVNPLAFGKHPVDAYSGFMEKHVKVEIAPMSDDNFFKTYGDASCFIAGVIVEVKYNQIGDFHTGPLPSDDDKKHMGWGKRYANVNVEDVGGKQNRIKVDTDIFDIFRDVVDSGVGTPVIVAAAVNKKYENLRAHFLIDMERYRKKIDKGETLTVWEKIIHGQHPARERKWKTEAVSAGRIANEGFYGFCEECEGGRASLAVGDKCKTGDHTTVYTGVVTNVKTKVDKRGGEMAFFGMIDASARQLEVVCFASIWVSIMKLVKSGNLLKIYLLPPDRSGGSHLVNQDMIDKALAWPVSAEPEVPKKTPEEAGEAA